eukprot:191846-Chlamydomonas_euryale.AAC.2
MNSLWDGRGLGVQGGRERLGAEKREGAAYRIGRVLCTRSECLSLPGERKQISRVCKLIYISPLPHELVLL